LGENNSLSFLVDFLVTNETVKDQVAISLDVKGDGTVNISCENFKVDVQVTKSMVRDVEVRNNNLGEFFLDYKGLLNAALGVAVNDFNTQYRKGIDLTKVIKALSFASGMLMHTVITPFQVDGYLYAGFSWLSDM